MILFSEATVHGALQWKANHQRRLALYRFSPSNFAYGRAYLNQFGEKVMDLCTEHQRAVLAGPFAVRLQRKVVIEDGEGMNYITYLEVKFELIVNNTAM